MPSVACVGLSCFFHSFSRIVIIFLITSDVYLFSDISLLCMRFSRYISFQAALSAIRCLDSSSFHGCHGTSRSLITGKTVPAAALKPPLFSSFLFFMIRQPPAFPHRLQCSIIGRPGLNLRVRDGYGCYPGTHRHRILSDSFFPRTLIIKQ